MVKMKADTRMEKTHNTDIREQNWNEEKSNWKSAFSIPLFSVQYYAGGKKKSNNKKKKKVLHWFGMSLRMGGHHINNNNKNQTVIP